MLETLSRFRPEGSAWCGSAPASGNAGELAEKIVSRPTSADIGHVDRKDAVVWLSLLAAHSLNHAIGREAAEPLLAKVEAGFSDLGEDARFFSVGRWEISRRGKHWEPLRADHRWLESRYHVNFSGPYSTGDGVVGAIMGFDQVSAFLFAVAEDD